MASASMVLGDPCYGLTSDQCASISGGAPASDSSGTAGWLSGLTGFASAISGLVSTSIQAATGHPATGPYQTSTGVNTSVPASGISSNMLLLAGVALVAVLLLRRK